MMGAWLLYSIFFSGLEHSLAGLKYNLRVDALRSGVYALQAFAGIEYGKFQEANARDGMFRGRFIKNSGTGFPSRLFGKD